MTEEVRQETPHADHLAHTATEEPHPPRLTLWQRWMAWSGSFLVLSILLHVLLLGGATVLVVQVIQGRKEKLKFTAPPPSAAAAAEHKVKPSKKSTAAAPAVSKRITSTAANAQIALPAMEMNSSSPDVMASVMSGMGSAGLGNGSGAAGGMASMPLSGLTAFGFKGAAGGGLKGHFYDLKLTKDRGPTDMASDAPHFKVLDEFFSKSWDEGVLQKFYQAKDTMVTYQVYIPIMAAGAAPKAFDVEKEVKPSHWVVHYKGNVTAPKDGTFRFLGWADDVLAVRFNGQNVFFAGTCGRTGMTGMKKKFFPDDSMTSPSTVGIKGVGKWFTVERGRTYPMEVLISEIPGSGFGGWLLIEDKNPEVPYLKKLSDPAHLAYPLFQTKKGIPLPSPSGNAPEIARDPVVFTGK